MPKCLKHSVIILDFYLIIIQEEGCRFYSNPDILLSVLKFQMFWKFKQSKNQWGRKEYGNNSVILHILTWGLPVYSL